MYINLAMRTKKSHIKPAYIFGMGRKNNRDELPQTSTNGRLSVWINVPHCIYLLELQIAYLEDHQISPTIY